MGTRDDIIIPATTSWLADPAAQAVCGALQNGGYEVYFVGGCVRNALLGVPDSDVDMSTNALPENVIELAKASGLKAVPTGIDHGTITVVADGKPFEITTFRRDVETDGRRAVVAFSDNIQEDARRRDFTMNALYAAPTGVVVDPLGGLPDLYARRIRFIEDADARIREDYLRTLRFFRFSAWYGDPAQGFDPDALGAIADNLDGLDTLSAERIGHEMRKLLSAPDPATALAGMRSTGVLHQILPGSDDRWIGPIVHFETQLAQTPSWILRLAALGGQDIPAKLRLSNLEARALETLKDVAFEMMPLTEVAYRHGADTAIHALMLRSAMAEQEPDNNQLAPIYFAAAAQFPVAASDLMPTFKGPALGARLAELEQAWIDSGFALKKGELLNYG